MKDADFLLNWHWANHTWLFELHLSLHVLVRLLMRVMDIATAAHGDLYFCMGIRLPTLDIPLSGHFLCEKITNTKKFPPKISTWTFFRTVLSWTFRPQTSPRKNLWWKISPSILPDSYDSPKCQLSVTAMGCMFFQSLSVFSLLDYRMHHLYLPFLMRDIDTADKKNLWYQLEGHGDQPGTSE